MPAAAVADCLHAITLHCHMRSLDARSSQAQTSQKDPKTVAQLAPSACCYCAPTFVATNQSNSSRGLPACGHPKLKAAEAAVCGLLLVMLSSSPAAATCCCLQLPSTAAVPACCRTQVDSWLVVLPPEQLLVAVSSVSSSESAAGNLQSMEGV